MALDEQMLGECVGRYTISHDGLARLQQFNGLASTPLYHPPLLAPRLTPGEYGSLRAVGGAAGEATSASISSCGRWRTCPSRSRWSSSARAATASSSSRRPKRPAWRLASASPARCDDNELVTLYRDALAWSTCRSTRTTGSPRSKRSSPRSRSSPHATRAARSSSCTDGVNGLVVRRPTRGDRRARWRGSTAIARSRARLGERRPRSLARRHHLGRGRSIGW